MSAAIGVDIGGTKLLAIRYEDGVAVDEYRTVKPDDGDLMVAGVLEAVAKLARNQELTACGVGVAGLVDFAAGTFVWGPHVDGIGIELRDELAEELDVPVVVDNDANTTAFAEHRVGAGRGSNAMLMLTLGTGIGGAMVIDGEVYRGRRFAGEFGHARLARSDQLCDCGHRGCWETEAAGPALERMARDLIESDPHGSLARALAGGEAEEAAAAVSGPRVTAAAAAGDPQAIALITQIGRAFGQGLAAVISMVDPDRIVIGGGLGSIGEVLLDPIRKSASEARYAAAHWELPPILPAELGEQAGAVGAALLALHEAGDE